MLLTLQLGGALAVSQPPHSALREAPAAPYFVAPDLAGTAVNLVEYQGRPIILNFWATWCAPCRQEMPVLQELYTARQDTGLIILAINEDDHGNADAIRAYMNQAGLTFRALLDPQGKVATLYNVVVLPSTVFINTTGKIIATHIGPLSRPQMERYLAAMLPPPG